MVDRGLDQRTHRLRALARRVALAGAVLGGAMPAASLATPPASRATASADAERPPWAPEKWLNPAPRLTAVRMQTRPSRLELAFRPHDDPRAELHRPAPDRIELHLPEIGDPPDLPIVEAPFIDLEWRTADPGSALVVTLEPGARVVLERRGAVWALRRIGEAPGEPPPSEDRSTPAPEGDRWAPPSDRTPFEAELHRAVADAHAGRGAQAIERLHGLLDGELPKPYRAAIHLVEAGLALREGLPMIALDAAARVSRWAADPLTRRAAHRLLLEIESRLPGALAIVGHDIAPDLLARARPGDEAMLYAVGRAMLRLDDPYTAAELLHRVHFDRRWRERARFLAYVAARQAGDLEAAERHLIALSAGGTDRLPPRLRVEVTLAWARHSYETAPERAVQAYASAAATAAALEPEGRAAEAIRVEQGWLDLRHGKTLEVLQRMLPLDLEAHGAPRTLLVATLYHRLCYPRRAAAVATALIERLELDGIQTQLATERGILAHETWSASRQAFSGRLSMLAEHYEDIARLSPEAYWLRQARRSRISAMARASDEVVEHMREDREAAPREPALPAWRATSWTEPPVSSSRCEPPPR